MWVALPGDRPRPLWHLWHDGAAYVVTGGGEQPLPGAAAADRAEVTAPGQGASGQVLTWTAAVTRVQPGGPLWDEVAPLLEAKRLNAPGDEPQRDRWARECVVLRLDPR